LLLLVWWEKEGSTLIWELNAPIRHAGCDKISKEKMYFSCRCEEQCL
jgi:hypothetical protein